MVSPAYISHHIPGRIRIRIPAAKANPALLNKFREISESITAVQRIDCNQLTGSVLIHYAPGGHEDFEKSLSERGDWAAAFSLVNDLRQLRDAARGSTAARSHAFSDTANAFVDYFEDLDGKVKSATGNALDLKVLLPLVAATAGILTIRKAVPTPLWLTLVIFAFSTFLLLHPLENLKEDDQSRDRPTRAPSSNHRDRDRRGA